MQRMRHLETLKKDRCMICMACPEMRASSSKILLRAKGLEILEALVAAAARDLEALMISSKVLKIFLAEEAKVDSIRIKLREEAEI